MRFLRPFAAVVVFCAIPSIAGAQWLEHAIPKEQQLSSPKKRVKWFYDQRTSGGEIPEGAYTKAVVRAQSMKHAAPKGLDHATRPQWN